MSQLVVKLSLIIGLVGAIAFAATPPSWAAAKKRKKVVAAKVAAPPAAAPADVPGSEMLKPPTRVAPIFPYEATPGQ